MTCNEKVTSPVWVLEAVKDPEGCLWGSRHPYMFVKRTKCCLCSEANVWQGQKKFFIISQKICMYKISVKIHCVFLIDFVKILRLVH